MIGAQRGELPVKGKCLDTDLVGEDHEVAFVIRAGDDLDIGRLALDEADEGKAGLGLQIHGRNLSLVDPKVVCVLHNGILDDEQGHPSKKTGLGNQSRLHVADKDGCVLVLQAEEEGVLGGKHRSILGHPLHGSLVLLLLLLRDCPIRNKGTDVKGCEAAVGLGGEALDFDIVAPEVAVAGWALGPARKDLMLVLLVDDPRLLVPHNGWSEDEGCWCCACVS